MVKSIIELSSFSYENQRNRINNYNEPEILKLDILEIKNNNRKKE